MPEGSGSGELSKYIHGEVAVVIRWLLGVLSMLSIYLQSPHCPPSSQLGERLLTSSILPLTSGTSCGPLSHFGLKPSTLNPEVPEI